MTNNANVRAIDRGEIEIRRHNGQCAYGEWETLGARGMDSEIAEAVCEADGECGMVTVGGQGWVWRRHVEPDLRRLLAKGDA